MGGGNWYGNHWPNYGKGGINKAHLPCFDWQRTGACWKGDGCQYSHSTETGLERDVPERLEHLLGRKDAPKIEEANNALRDLGGLTKEEFKNGSEGSSKANSEVLSALADMSKANQGANMSLVEALKSLTVDRVKNESLKRRKTEGEE